jgi:uncharacterized protein YodC (DUF2158 family)
MSKKFSTGDTVTLKSGGQLMTVNGYKRLLNPDGSYEESNEDVVCVWFNKNEQKSAIYHQDALIKEEIE